MRRNDTEKEKEYYTITEKGRNFYHRNRNGFWSANGWSGASDVTEPFTSFTMEIMNFLSWNDSSVIAVTKDVSGLHQNAWEYCINHSLVHEIKDREALASILMDKATKFSDGEFSKNIIRYIEMAFDDSSSDEIDHLYQYLDEKMKILTTRSWSQDYFLRDDCPDEDVEWAEKENGENWREIHRDRSEESFRDNVEEYHRFVSFKDKYGKKIACDYVISRLHDHLTKPMIDDDDGGCGSFQFRDLFGLEGEDISLIIDILTTLSDDGVWNYIVDSRGSRDKDESNQWILERNSEHGRKKDKQTKRRKIQEIKKHTMRKQVQS